MADLITVGMLKYFFCILQNSAMVLKFILLEIQTTENLGCVETSNLWFMSYFAFAAFFEVTE